MTALDHLFRSADLRIVDVEELSIHGGSLRVFAAPGSVKHRTPRVDAILKEEQLWGVGQLETYATFCQKVHDLRETLTPLLRRLKAQGSRLAAYGASAKGSTLLNFCGLGRDELDLVVDRNLVKQGKFTPGMRRPIHPPESLLTEMPDYVLLLTWNFQDEILAQQDEYRRRGGKFIIPVHSPSIV